VVGGDCGGLDWRNLRWEKRMSPFLREGGGVTGSDQRGIGEGGSLSEGREGRKLHTEGRDIVVCAFK